MAKYEKSLAAASSKNIFRGEFKMIKKSLIALFVLVNISFGQTLELSSTVISDNEKFITSRFMGFIKSVHVSEGSMVKKRANFYMQ